MNYVERKKQIIECLDEKGGVISVEALSKKLYVSRSTLRRDLIQLENEGLIIRHHGGITLMPNSASETSIEQRRMENPEKKSYIARLASSFIHDNMVIFLDSSSTVSYLIPLIKRHKNITIVTNGINIATQLNDSESLKCYVCPGILKNKSLSILGEYSADFLSNFRAEAVFLSCKAVNTNGIFEGDDSQALSKKNMMKNADKKILLCDNTKEYATGYFKLADFAGIDHIISNAPFSNRLMEKIRESGCSCILP